MKILQKVKPLFFRREAISKTENPDAAYDLWASAYDSQPDNMMLAWDEKIFSELLSNMDLHNKIIVDIGCGTGRHWKKIFDFHPKKLIGFDVSEEMLKMLQRKFPHAETHHLLKNDLNHLENESCNIIFSTLTIAHIENVKNALQEWSRILKPGGEIIITDFHPAALAKGAKRTFNHNGKTIAVKNYVHSIDNLKHITRQLHWEVFRLIEKSIDESARPFYEKQHAVHVYESWKGTPIIYGIHLKKSNAAL